MNILFKCNFESILMIEKNLKIFLIKNSIARIKQLCSCFPAKNQGSMLEDQGSAGSDRRRMEVTQTL